MTQIIYIKFLIQYDKAGEATSYPSLTEYEIATFLDKAYNALIAQKVTGNNYRRSTYESDIKSIADLSPLITSNEIDVNPDLKYASNIVSGELPKDLLYFLQATVKSGIHTTYTAFDNGSAEQGSDKKYSPADENLVRTVPIKLVTHDAASNFFVSMHNMPWIKQPVCFLENGEIYIVYDPLDPIVITPGSDTSEVFYFNGFVTITHPELVPGQPSSVIYATDYANHIVWNLVDNRFYIKQGDNFYRTCVFYNPETQQSISFDELNYNDGSERLYYNTNSDNQYYPIGYYKSDKTFASGGATIMYIRKPNTFVKDLDQFNVNDITYFDDHGANLPEYQFECNSTMAEELISLAVSFALENVESQRLNSKLNMRGLEA